MKKLPFVTTALLGFGLLTAATSPAPTPPAGPLTSRQQAIVAISALTAKGNLPQLNKALNDGLNTGLTVNEEKEVLVQLYAYCGFPRSLQGLNTLLKVLDERKAKGLQIVTGRDVSPITSAESKYVRGTQNLEKLTGKPGQEPKTGVNAFSPEIDRFLKEHLFADIFDRDILTYQERELATISALVSLGGVEPMLQSHIGNGLHVGLTEGQLRQLLTLDEQYIGKKDADAGRAVLAKALASQDK